MHRLPKIKACRLSNFERKLILSRVHVHKEFSMDRFGAVC